MATQSVYKSAASKRAVMDIYDRALAIWTVPYAIQYVATRFGQTHVISCGPDGGPPLILLHGAGANSGMWGPEVPVLSEEHRLYAVDLIGEAGRSAPSRPAWEGAAFADWLADVLDGLRLTTAVLTGHSQGGWVALKFAVSYPERVKALALLSPGGVVPDKLSFFVKAALLIYAGGWGTRQITAMLFADEPVSPEAIEYMTIFTKHFKPRKGILPIYGNEELRRLTMPVLLIAGRKDAIRDADDMAARLKKEVPQTEMIIRPDAGHALLNTGAEISAFLQRQRAI